MPYDTSSARREMLAEIARAIGELEVALAALAEAYELLDEANAERLEKELFGPIQTADGRAKRTYAAFALRAGLPSRAFAPASAGAPSRGAGGFVEDAIEAAARADQILADLQDSLRPVDVGDPELRAGLSEVRRLLAGVPPRARNFTRTLGR